MSYSKLLEQTVSFLEERKAENIIAIDMRDKSPFTDACILVTAPNMRAAGAYAELLEEFFAKNKIGKCRKEGEPESGWILVDVGEIVVHIFTSIKRSEINLQELLISK